MNIWQDSNNAMNNSIPNSSTASEELSSKEILNKYSKYLDKEQRDIIVSKARTRGKRSGLMIYEDYGNYIMGIDPYTDEDSKGNS